MNITVLSVTYLSLPRMLQRRSTSSRSIEKRHCTENIRSKNNCYSDIEILKRSTIYYLLLRLVSRVQKKIPTNSWRCDFIIRPFFSLLFPLFSAPSSTLNLFIQLMLMVTAEVVGWFDHSLENWKGMALSSSRLWQVWRFRDPLSILSKYFHCRGTVVELKV